MNYKAKELDLDVPVLSSILPSNRLQIDRALDMVTRTGRKRIGVLGFSFKAGTDDLRESPMVTLIETLIGKGYQLSIYDRDVSLARLVGANKEYIEKEIPHISELMSDSMSKIIDEAEVIIVGNKAPEFEQIKTMVREGQTIIDLVRLFSSTDVPAKYDGISW